MSFKEYKENDTLLKNIIYSSKGNWAIILTMDNYGILASTEEFMSEYKKNYPEWKKDIEQFKDYFNASNFNLKAIEKTFNYIIENENDLTEEDRTLSWKK